MSTVYLELRNLPPKEFVSLASNLLRLRFADSITNADRSFRERLTVVENDAQRRRENGEFSDFRGDVRHNWSMFLKEIDKVLTEYFEALVDTMVEIGSNPQYAKYAVPNPPKWAYQSLQSLYSQLEEHTLQKVIPLLTGRLGPDESWGSLVREFQTAIDGHRHQLLETAELRLAEWKPAEATSDEQTQSEPKETVEQPTLPAPQQAVEQPTLPTPQQAVEQPTPQLPNPCRFTLADLGAPFSKRKVSKHKVSRELYPTLYTTLDDARTWVNQEALIGHQVPFPDIVKRYPLLKDLKPNEMKQYIVEAIRDSVEQAAIEIMTNHARVEEKTMRGYVTKTPPEDKKLQGHREKVSKGSEHNENNAG